MGNIKSIGGNPIVLGLDGLKDEVKAGLNTPADIPGLAVGSAAALFGDPETASWVERTTAADGAALIEAIYGNTIVQDGSLLPVRMEGVETVAADESWSSQRTIPAATYFPDGLRSAGTVRDELRADAAVTRVGAVDLGTLTWIGASTSESGVYRTYSAGIKDLAKGGQYGSSLANAECARYPIVSANATYAKETGLSIDTFGNLYIYDPNYTTVAAIASFQSAMSGVYLFYELASPTTQSIDPPLPMSYRTGAGGTERVMVASGTQSAPPVFATRYPLDPTDLAASIAPVDGPIAKTNHQVGDLLMLGFTLCKATQVIVTGETIEIGTNVTRTSVAAELAALSE